MSGFAASKKESRPGETRRVRGPIQRAQARPGPVDWNGSSTGAVPVHIRTTAEGSSGNRHVYLTDAASVGLGVMAAVKYNQPFLDSVPDFS